LESEGRWAGRGEGADGDEREEGGEELEVSPASSSILRPFGSEMIGNCCTYLHILTLKSVEFFF